MAENLNELERKIDILTNAMRILLIGARANIGASNYAALRLKKAARGGHNINANSAAACELIDEILEEL